MKTKRMILAVLTALFCVSLSFAATPPSGAHIQDIKWEKNPYAGSMCRITIRTVEVFDNNNAFYYYYDASDDTQRGLANQFLSLMLSVKANERTFSASYSDRIDEVYVH